jgi:hypothetical protein
MEDTPRTPTNNKSPYTKDYNMQDPEDFMIEFYTLLEKSRIPGHFDYSVPQTYHALYPDIEQMHYVTIDGETHRNLTISDYAN